MIRLLAPMTLLASPVFAQEAGTLGLPPLCQAFVTVQKADCSVAHYLTCSGDPAGQKYSVTQYSTGGDSISVMDAESQWLVTADAYAGTVETLVPDPADPGLLSDVLAGSDSYDFSTVGKDGTETRYVGKEELMGRLVTIDGVELQMAYNEMRAIDETGFELWSASGTEYVSAEWGVYFGGPTDWVTPEQSYPSDPSPVSFDFPGDPGFLTTVPVYGCTG